MPGNRRKSIYQVRRMRKNEIQDEIEKAGIVVPQGKILKKDLIKIYENNMTKISEYSSSDSESEIDEKKGKSSSEEEWIPGKDFAELMDVNVELKSMSNAAVSRLLDSYKIEHGPVVDSTRQVYMKKLLKSMKESKIQHEPNAQSENGSGDASVKTKQVLNVEQYSCDDDDEEEEGEIVTEEPKVLIQCEGYSSKSAKTEIDIPAPEHSISYSQTIKDNSVQENIETISKSVGFCETTLTRRNVTTSEKVIKAPVVNTEKSTSCVVKLFKMIMILIATSLFVLLMMALHIILKKYSVELY